MGSIYGKMMHIPHTVEICTDEAFMSTPTMGLCSPRWTALLTVRPRTVTNTTLNRSDKMLQRKICCKKRVQGTFRHGAECHHNTSDRTTRQESSTYCTHLKGTYCETPVGSTQQHTSVVRQAHFTHLRRCSHAENEQLCWAFSCSLIFSWEQ